MDGQKIIRLERKQSKQRALIDQDESTDFILDYCQSMLSSELSALQCSSEKDQTSSIKTLILHAQDPYFRMQLADAGVQSDQIPFSDLLSPRVSRELASTVRSYDQLISNLTIDWIDAANLISSIQSLLSPKGRLWLTAFGPQTAGRSQSILSRLSPHAHFNTFYELKDIGDALAAAGFKEVLVESRVINLDYHSVNVLFRDAQRIFGLNTHPDRLKSLCPKVLVSTFRQRIEEIILNDGVFTEQVEIIVARGRMPSKPSFGPQIPVIINAG